MLAMDTEQTLASTTRTAPRLAVVTLLVALVVAGQLAGAGSAAAQATTVTPTPAQPIQVFPIRPIPIARPARALAIMHPVSSSVTASGRLQDASNGASAQTGVNVPGDFQKLPDGSFLVAGRRSGANGNGVVEYWRKDVFGNLFGASYYERSGSDFSGVVWDPNSGQLYLLDALKKKIWSAPWSGLGQLPTSWTTWATTADVGALNSARDRYLDLVWPDGDDPATDPAHVYLGRYPDFVTQGRALSGSPGNISNDLWDWLDEDLAPDILIDSSSVSEGSSLVTVSAPSPPTTSVPLDVVHVETGLVTGVATLPAGAESVTLSLGSPVVIGDSYVARKVGDPTESHWAMRAMRRYGFPETFADGTALRPIFTPPDSYICNPILTMLVGIEIDPANPPVVAEQDFFGTMRVGVRSFSDPVVALGGGQYLLSPTTQVVPAVGKMGLSGHGLIGATIALPCSGGAVGDVWFVQFEVTDPNGGGTVRSGVVGFEILPFS